MVEDKSKAKVQAVFVGKRKGREGWPSKDFDPESRRDTLLAKLKDECENIEFTDGTVVLNFNEIEVEEEVDGVLIYILSSGTLKGKPDLSSFRKHPLILVNDIFGGDKSLLEFYDMAQKEDLPVLPISSSEFKEVKSALHLIEVIHNMKNSKILNIGKSEDAGDQSHWWRRKPRKYLNKLKEVFGTEVVTIGREELIEYYQNVDEGPAKKLASEWIGKAVKVIEPSEEEIKKSAKMYYAIKKAMEEVDADTVTIDCITMTYSGKIPAYPCLALMQLNDEGFTAVCESDLESTITQLLVRHLAGRSSFVSDPAIDTSANQIIYAHCVAPTKMLGKNGLPLPFVIRSHAEDDEGACGQIIMPLNKTVTTIKIKLLD